MVEGEPEEHGRISERTFEGSSRGPGASLERALQQAARAAAEAGYRGPLALTYVEIEPQAHNQWIRAFRVIATGTGSG